MQKQRVCEELAKRPDSTDGLTISQLARATGVNAKAIRYYESIGLLPPPLRGTNRYRRYSLADVNRLSLLRSIRYLGVPLAVARPLLIGASDARCVDVQQELLQLVARRVTELDQEIAELRQLQSELELYQQELASYRPVDSEAFSACVDMSCIVVASVSSQERNNEDAY